MNKKEQDGKLGIGLYKTRWLYLKGNWWLYLIKIKKVDIPAQYINMWCKQVYFGTGEIKRLFYLNIPQLTLPKMSIDYKGFEFHALYWERVNMTVFSSNDKPGGTVNIYAMLTKTVNPANNE